MALMYDGDRITFTRRFPSFSYFVTAEHEVKVLEYEDHLEVWRADRRGRWRRRKTLPTELAKYFSVLDKYEVKVGPADEDWKSPLPSAWSGVDAGPVCDPAFMPRESNPTVRISTEDGEVIWSA